MTEVDWGWKLREAVERIKTAYAHIGRSSGAPILAILYPPEQEIAVLKEWHTLMASLQGTYDVRTVDALEERRMQLMTWASTPSSATSKIQCPALILRRNLDASGSTP